MVWSEQSRKCPLCTRPLGEYIVHHIRSRTDFQRRFLPPLRTSPPLLPLRAEAASETQRRSRLSRDERDRRRRELARAREREEMDRLDQAIQKRKWVYAHGLYAKHVATNPFTRYKPHPTPSQFAASPDLIGRATVWIRRELRVWPSLDVEFLVTFVISLMKSLDIRSEGAIRLLSEFLDMDSGVHSTAEHFAHELYCYLRSPYKDPFVYDTVVQYDSVDEAPVKEALPVASTSNLSTVRHDEVYSRPSFDNSPYQSPRALSSSPERSRSRSRQRQSPPIRSEKRPRRQRRSWSRSPTRNLRPNDRLEVPVGASSSDSLDIRDYSSFGKSERAGKEKGKGRAQDSLRFLTTRHEGREDVDNCSSHPSTHIKMELVQEDGDKVATKPSMAQTSYSSSGSPTSGIPSTPELKIRGQAIQIGSLEGQSQQPVPMETKLNSGITPRARSLKDSVIAHLRLPAQKTSPRTSANIVPEIASPLEVTDAPLTDNTCHEGSLEELADGRRVPSDTEVMTRTRLRLACMRHEPVAGIAPSSVPSTPPTPLGEAGPSDIGTPPTIDLSRSDTPAVDDEKSRSQAENAPQQVAAEQKASGANVAMEARLRQQAQLRVRLARARREAATDRETELGERLHSIQGNGR